MRKQTHTHTRIHLRDTININRDKTYKIILYIKEIYSDLAHFLSVCIVVFLFRINSLILLLCFVYININILLFPVSITHSFSFFLSFFCFFSSHRSQHAMLLRMLIRMMLFFTDCLLALRSELLNIHVICQIFRINRKTKINFDLVLVVKHSS